MASRYSSPYPLTKNSLLLLLLEDTGPSCGLLLPSTTRSTSWPSGIGHYTTLTHLTSPQGIVTGRTCQVLLDATCKKRIRAPKHSRAPAAAYRMSHYQHFHQHRTTSTTQEPWVCLWGLHTPLNVPFRVHSTSQCDFLCVTDFPMYLGFYSYPTAFFYYNVDHNLIKYKPFSHLTKVPTLRFWMKRQTTGWRPFVCLLPMTHAGRAISLDVYCLFPVLCTFLIFTRITAWIKWCDT